MKILNPNEIKFKVEKALSGMDGHALAYIADLITIKRALNEADADLVSYIANLVLDKPIVRLSGSEKDAIFSPKDGNIEKRREM